MKVFFEFDIGFLEVDWGERGKRIFVGVKGGYLGWGEDGVY